MPTTKQMPSKPLNSIRHTEQRQRTKRHSNPTRPKTALTSRLGTRDATWPICTTPAQACCVACWSGTRTKMASSRTAGGLIKLMTRGSWLDQGECHRSALHHLICARWKISGTYLKYAVFEGIFEAEEHFHLFHSLKNGLPGLLRALLDFKEDRGDLFIVLKRSLSCWRYQFLVR